MGGVSNLIEDMGVAFRLDKKGFLVNSCMTSIPILAYDQFFSFYPIEVLLK